MLSLIRNYLLSATHDGIVTDALGECVDYGQYPQVYGNYPWGQGAALAFLAAYEACIASDGTPASDASPVTEEPA